MPAEEYGGENVSRLACAVAGTNANEIVIAVFAALVAVKCLVAMRHPPSWSDIFLLRAIPA